MTMVLTHLNCNSYLNTDIIDEYFVLFVFLRQGLTL